LNRDEERNAFSRLLLAPFQKKTFHDTEREFDVAHRFFDVQWYFLGRTWKELINYPAD